MYRKYYSYNDTPRPVKSQMPVPVQECKPEQHSESCEKKGGILGRLENDDLILAAVLIILLMDGCDDKLLIAAVAMLLLGEL